MNFVHFLESGQTINSDLLYRVVESLKENTFRYQHDKAMPHTTTKDQIANFGWIVLLHPPYNPDLAPSDFSIVDDNES